MFKGKKALVAGGAGFIGANLTMRLANLGCAVKATLRSRPPVFKHPMVEYHHADLTKMDVCKAMVEGMDYVFLCAANT